MKKILNYINGLLTEPLSGNYFDNFNPSNGKVYSLVPDSDNSDVEMALQSAEKAFPLWASKSNEQRAAILLKIAELIEKNLDTFAHAESVDNGKPFSLAKQVDIPRAASNFRFYAMAVTQFASESHSMGNLALNYTLRQPIGVTACISPWNLPLYLFTWKIAPALAAGNCVIAKPSEVTPMTAFLLSELCIEAGLPPGVLNIIHGFGHKVGRAIVSHPAIPAISFTGGTKTGAEIASIAAPMFKKVSLELGGKNPNIIFADCDFEQALSTTIKSSFSNQGEICLCGSRIFIERPLYEKFKTEFVERTRRLKIGNPLSDVNLGAIVSKSHLDKILYYVQLAKEEGGSVLCGGNQYFPGGELNGGWYVEPTIIEGLAYDCRTNREEIFGPLVTIMPFDIEEEVLKMANSSVYGLSATIWTQNLKRAHQIAANIQAGIVWVNCWLLRDLRTPFGGVKNSGMGREGGFEALRFFTEEKNVCIKY